MARFWKWFAMDSFLGLKKNDRSKVTKGRTRTLSLPVSGSVPYALYQTGLHTRNTSVKKIEKLLLMKTENEAKKTCLSA